MTLSEKYGKLKGVKFSVSKRSKFAENFARASGAFSMFDDGFGLGIAFDLSAEDKLRAVFLETIKREGKFLFNLSGVDLLQAKRGFASYKDADESYQITEWEFFMILTNNEYLKNCIFHNGKVEFKKRLILRAIRA
ncbi:MAG: hypothetical protein ABJA70_06490 [Chryseolinea sp.]